MKDHFFCWYCRRDRKNELHAGKRRGKNQCVTCKEEANHNVRNHSAAEETRKHYVRNFKVKSDSRKAGAV